MPRFVVLYRAPQDVAERFATATPEEAQAGAGLWTKWFAEIGPALVDPGRPLGGAVTVTQQGTVPASTDIVGMNIVQADDMDAALALVRHHHHLQWSEACSITVLEEMPIPEVAAGLVG